VERAGFIALRGDDVAFTVTRALHAPGLAPDAALEAGDGADHVADVVRAERGGALVPGVGPDRLLDPGAAEERLGPARDGRVPGPRRSGRGLGFRGAQLPPLILQQLEERGHGAGGRGA